MRHLVLLLLSASAWGATVYSWSDMGTISGTSTAANSINANGDVVGGYFSGTGFHAWRYSGGVFTDLGTMGGIVSEAFAINDSGQIAGRSQIANTEEYAFRYSGGMFTNLGSLGGTNSIGWGMNNSGLVTGYAFVPGDTSYYAFISDGTTMTNLGAAGGLASGGYAINSSGQVAGLVYIAPLQQRAMFYDGTTMHNIGTLGGDYGFARAINDAGQIAGYAKTVDDVIHAFSYTALGGMQDLGTLGGNQSFAFGINSAGWITGVSFDPLLRNRAFLWNGSTMLDINDLTFTTPLPTVLTVSMDINDAGQIIANGDNGKAYLLTPQGAGPAETPEPATWIMLATGLSLVALRARRNRR